MTTLCRECGRDGIKHYTKLCHPCYKKYASEFLRPDPPTTKPKKGKETDDND